MSVQTINLMHTGLVPKRELLTFRDLRLGVIGLLAVLTVISLAKIVTLYESKAEARQLTAQQEKLKAARQQLQRTGVVALDTTLEAEVRNLREAALLRSRLAKLLAAERLGTSQEGFSGHLEELSELAIDGLWLTEIELVNAEVPTAKLKGKAANAALVPTFVRALSTGEHFVGYRFSSFLVEANDDSDLSFLIEGPGDTSE